MPGASSSASSGTSLPRSRSLGVPHSANPHSSRVTRNLEHPGIPAVYERGLDRDGAPFYAMRRAQGRTFAKLLADADTVHRRLALLPVVTRVAQTIGFAHDRGVVHRDIKPDNIIV